VQPLKARLTTPQSSVALTWHHRQGNHKIPFHIPTATTPHGLTDTNCESAQQ
jgi:hypothetical protein